MAGILHSKGLRKGGAGRAAALRRAENFRAFSGAYPSGVAQLPAELTINSITETPALRYNGKDATATTWPAWGYGDDLAIAGSGASPTLNTGSPGLGSDDGSVCYNLGKEHQNPDADDIIGTNDFVIEVVFKPNLAGNMAIMGNRPGGGYSGWMLYANSGVLYLFIADAGGTAIATIGSFDPGTWNQSLVFGDRSGSVLGYINNVAGTPANISARSGTLNSGVAFTIGGTALRGSGWNADANVAYAAIWSRTLWLDTHLKPDIAAERFALFSGNYPQTSKGTATPEVMTRTTAAHMRKVESDGRTKLYQVGANWMRTEKVKDVDGNTIIGHLSESEGENEFLHSTDYDNAAWTKTRATISGTTAIAPDGSDTAQGIVADSVPSNQTHSVGQAMASSAGEHEWSEYHAAGDKTWIYKDIPTVSNADLYYDIANDTFGTVGAGITNYYSEDMGTHDGKVWRRVVVCYTGGAPSHAHNNYPAESDGDHNFTGDDSTVNVWCWGPMHEHSGTGRASSYYTTGAAVGTRTKDQLRYKADDGNVTAGTGTVTGIILCQNERSASESVLSINDGGATTNDILLSVNTSDQLAATVTAGGVSQASLTTTTTVDDGKQHTFKLSWTTNSIKLYIDGALEATDTSATIPANLDRIIPGANASQAAQLNGLVSNLKIYSKVV